jgi:S-adenosylmethionine synthetase
MLASAIKCELDADTALKTARSIAYLDKAGEYLASKGIKDSSSAREKYIDVDEDVVYASNVKAKSTALVHLLKNKMQEFRMAHDDVKKLAYADEYQSPTEGF